MSAGNFIIRRKTLISMLFIGLVMLGVISQRRLSVELIPDIELPYLFVRVMSMGPADPVRVEKEAVIPIEEAAGTLEGIERIESNIGRGSGSITIEYNKGIDIKYAYLKLEEKITEIRSISICCGWIPGKCNSIVQDKLTGKRNCKRLKYKNKYNYCKNYIFYTLSHF